ncbi:MAG: MlaE family ABC transporter permease [Planctomycetota bacterium]
MPVLLAHLRSALISVGEWGGLLADASYWFIPRRLRGRHGMVPSRETFLQLDRLTFGVLPLVTVVLFFVGMILALQLATILKLLGVLEYVPDIVGVAMVREMAPLLIGVVLAGFAGAAIAAEIGGMKVSEELKAMDSFAMPPSRFLVAPRLAAVALAGPLVTAAGFHIGIGGGLAVSWSILGIEPGQYLTRTIEALVLDDVVLGLVKGEAFGVIVVAIACFEGMRVKDGAFGVGRATTSAVVKSVVAIIAADLFLTVLFFNIS